jgi:Polyphosphate kinase 2 (PPK2)
MITVFNRSYYEDILVPSVQKFIKPDIIKSRYEHLNSFEKLLVDEGTIVLKFFLHISKEVQLTRLVDRIKEKEKHWKHDVQDFKSRKHWDEYMKVYQSIFNTTDTPTAPWHIIPSDDKWYKIHLITKTILSTLNSLPMKWPALVQPSPLYSHDKDSHPSDEKKLRKAAKEKEKIEKEAQKESKKAEKDRLKAQKKAAKAQKKLLKEKEKMAKKAEKEAKKLAKHKAKEAKKLEHKKEKIEKKSKVASPKVIKAVPQTKKVVAKKTLPAKKPAAKKAPTASKSMAASKPASLVAPATKKSPTKKSVAPKTVFKTTPLKKPMSATTKVTPKATAKK